MLNAASSAGSRKMLVLSPLTMKPSSEKACRSTSTGLSEMARFDIYPNPDAARAADVPYLLDVQCDLLAALDSRVVIPLRRVDRFSVGRATEKSRPGFRDRRPRLLSGNAQAGCRPRADTKNAGGFAGAKQRGDSRGAGLSFSGVLSGRPQASTR
jgi:hypothetical protein